MLYRVRANAEQLFIPPGYPQHTLSETQMHTFLFLCAFPGGLECCPLVMYLSDASFLRISPLYAREYPRYLAQLAQTQTTRAFDLCLIFT